MTFLNIILILSGIIALVIIIAGVWNLMKSGDERFKWLLFIAVGVMTLLNLILFWTTPVAAP